MQWEDCGVDDADEVDLEDPEPRMLDSEMMKVDAGETKDQQGGDGWSGGMLDADWVVPGVVGVVGDWGVEMVEMEHLLQDHHDVLVSLLMRSHSRNLLHLRSCNPHCRLAFAICNLGYSVQAAFGKGVEMAGENAVEIQPLMLERVLLRILGSGVPP